MACSCCTGTDVADACNGGQCYAEQAQLEEMERAEQEDFARQRFEDECRRQAEEANR